MNENQTSLSVRRFTLDLHKLQSQISVSAFQGNTAIRLDIGITDGGIPYKIEEGTLATLIGTREEDGSSILHECSIIGNRIIYDFSLSTTAVLGVTKCNIKLSLAGEEKLTSPEFIIVVGEEAGNGDVIIEDYNDYEALDTLLSKAQGVFADEAVREANEEDRKANEAQRQTKEDERQTEEDKRVNAEAARVKAEEARQAQLDGKVNKTSAISKVYGTNLKGEEYLYSVSSTILQGAVVQRIGPDILVRDNPSRDDAAASKKYVDTQISDNIGSISSEKLDSLEERVSDLESLTLTYTEDSSTAYEKVAPAECGSKVQIKCIGGASEKVTGKNIANPADIKNFNHCELVSINADGSVDIAVYPNEEDGASWCTWEMPNVDTSRFYYWYEEVGEVVDGYLGAMPIHSSGNIEIICETTVAQTVNFKLMVWEAEEDLSNEYGDIYFGEPEAVFEPYTVSFRHANVERVDTLGANLLNTNADIGYPDNTAQDKATKRKFTPNTVIAGMSINNTYYSGNVVTIDQKTDNSITFTSNAGSRGVGYYLELKPNTRYTMSMVYDISTAGYAFLHYSEDGSFEEATYSRTNLTTSDSGKLIVLFYPKSAALTTTISEIMFVEGTTEVPYKPFKSEPLDSLIIPEAVRCKFGIDSTDYDYLRIVDGRVEKVQMCEELVLTGTETISKYVYSVTNGNGVRIANILIQDCHQAKGVCTDTDRVGSYSGSNAMWVGLNDAHNKRAMLWLDIIDILGLSTVDEFKTYLANRYASGNPVRIIYKLAEPIVTDVTADIIAANPKFSDPKKRMKLLIEGGSRTRVVNEHEMSVPSSVWYVKRKE